MNDLHPQCVKPNDQDRRDYDRLVHGWGFVDLSGRTQLELRGADRQAFLHNLCTNDIRRLRAGDGCEAFITNVQAKCLGHAFVFAAPHSLVLDSSPDQAARLSAHLDHYHITEDVEWTDRSDEWGEVLVAGPESPAWVAGQTGGDPLETMYAHRAAQCGATPGWIRRVPLTGVPSYLVAGTRADLPELQQQLMSQGAGRCSVAAFHMARVEAGFPWYGWDITDKNLPQEVNRNAAAISFQKGCYLGQETVARIDALGHVNRMAVVLQCHGPDVPPAGTTIMAEGQPVGEVTSSAASPALGAPLALCYVRRQFAEPGTRLQWASGTAVVRG
jgi:folate-binding protein YgfZ